MAVQFTEKGRKMRLISLSTVGQHVKANSTICLCCLAHLKSFLGRFRPQVVQFRSILLLVASCLLSRGLFSLRSAGFRVSLSAELGSSVWSFGMIPPPLLIFFVCSHQQASLCWWAPPLPVQDEFPAAAAADRTSARAWPRYPREPRQPLLPPQAELGWRQHQLPLR